MMKIATDKKIAFGDNSIRFFPIQSFQKKNRDPDFFVGTVVRPFLLRYRKVYPFWIRKVFYTFLHHKKIIKKTIIGVITFAFLISPFNLLHAEDYPAYLGSERSDYLQKIQTGYYPEVFIKIDICQKERVNKRNQAEEIAAYASQAAPESANGILAAQFEHKYNSDNLKIEIAERRQERENFASTNLETGFRYLPHSDGKIEYFKDGLLIKTENERVLDEFGNVNIRNSYNYQYNDKRLLTSFEADIKDILGNITHIRQYGIKYTADSLFYGGKDTSANKNLSEYYFKEIDPAGNERVTHFYNGTYEGKFLRAFSQTIEDSIYGNLSFTRTNITYADGDPDRPNSWYEEGKGTDGLAYTLDRTNTTYNGKNQTIGYHEEKITTHLDGGKIKTITDAQFKYTDVPHQFGPDVEEPDPDRLLESIITTTVENPDGSKQTETNTTTNNYDGLKLIGATGHSEFNGQEASWWEYKDLEGHILTRGEDEYGDVIYAYVDPETLKTVIVSEEEVSATLKDGNKYEGATDTIYKITEAGKPAVQRIDSRISYYGRDISPEQLQRTERTTTIYNVGLITYIDANGTTYHISQVLGRSEHFEITYPLLDPDNKYEEVRDLEYEYKYDVKGNLEDLILVSGIGSGWEYQPTQGWYGEHTSAITEEYDVILGKPIRTDYFEDKDYK